MDIDRPEHPNHHPRGRHQAPPANFHHQDHDLPRATSNRTLLDIIREEGGDVGGGRKKWKHFTDKLRPRRSSSFTSTVQVPTSDMPIMTRHGSMDLSDQQAGNSSFRRNQSQATDRPGFPSRRLDREEFSDEEDGEEEENGDDENENEDQYHGDGTRHEDGDDDDDDDVGDEEEKQQPVKMSLMALLAENDGTSYMMDDDEDDEDEDDDGDGGGGGGGGEGEYSSCCVCMVRHKGAAFIPCGHTFCRLCSRELLVQRGNCPLCNNYILEILDIY